MPYSNRDQDKSKGATEDDGRINTVPGNSSLPGQQSDFVLSNFEMNRKV